MRRKLIVLLATALMTVGIALPAPATTARDFAGVWTSTDAVDGSSQFMLVAPRDADDTRVVLFDRGASGACGDVSIPAIAIGPGVVSGDDMIVDFQVRCLDGSPPFTVTITFTLHPDGTLTDTGSPGTVWTHR